MGLHHLRSTTASANFRSPFRAPRDFRSPPWVSFVSLLVSLVEVGLVGEDRAEVAKHVVSSLSVPQAAHARPR